MVSDRILLCLMNEECWCLSPIEWASSTVVQDAFPARLSWRCCCEVDWNNCRQARNTFSPNLSLRTLCQLKLLRPLLCHWSHFSLEMTLLTVVSYFFVSFWEREKGFVELCAPLNHQQKLWSRTCNSKLYLKYLKMRRHIIEMNQEMKDISCI